MRDRGSEAAGPFPRTCPLAIAALVLAVTARAQAPGEFRESGAGTDALYVGVQAVDLSLGPGGGAMTLELYHSFSPRTSVNAGILHFSVAGSRWTYGRAGVTWKLIQPLTLHGEADVGSGKAAESFGYRQFRGGAGFELAGSGIVLELEDQYFEVQKTRGNVVKLGVGFPVSRFVRAAAAVHTTTSGNLGAESVTARVDVARHAFDVFGGLSLGSSSPLFFDLLTDGPAESSREVFAGVAIPIGTQRLTVALDYLARKQIRKGSVILSWKVPLRGF
jgi:hypothetical protein